MKTDFEQIKELCEAHLKINERNITRTERLGGLTNNNYKVETTTGDFVVRLPGVGTKELIDRGGENLCTKLANELKIDSDLLFFRDEDGVKIVKYIEEAETMSMNTIKELDNMKAVAEIFIKLHQSGKSVPVIFDVFEKIEEYEAVLRKCEGDYLWSDYEEVKAQVYSLETEVKNMNIESTFCHNDPLCENFVKGKDKMYLVDWEYAGMNDPMWDIADIFIEADFTPEEETQFNHFYFKQGKNDQIDRRILINKVFLDFLWSLWGKQRYSTGADLLAYANERYERAKENLYLLVK